MKRRYFVYLVMFLILLLFFIIVCNKSLNRKNRDINVTSYINDSGEKLQELERLDDVNGETDYLLN